MTKLADTLTRSLAVPVVDETGTSGVYTFTLEWTPDNQLSQADSGPSIFTTLQDKLGVRMLDKKVPVERIFVDGAVKPAAD